MAIPYTCPEISWIDYGDDPPSRDSVFPIVTKDQQYGLFNEVVTDWSDPSVVLAATGWPRYDGDIWSIQLTARPGYYVTPDQMVEYGLMAPDNSPPIG